MTNKELAALLLQFPEAEARIYDWRKNYHYPITSLGEMDDENLKWVIIGFDNDDYDEDGMYMGSSFLPVGEN